MRRLFLLVFWVVLAAIVFSTLCPIDLRPRTGHVISERFVAFALLGASFTGAYPRLFPASLFAAPIAAVVLEFSQTLVSGRHGHLADAGEKAAGGLVGAVVATLLLLWWEYRGRQTVAGRG